MGDNSLGAAAIVSAVFRHIRLLAIVFFGIIGLTILVCLTTHKKYSSEMKILVLNARNTPAVSAATSVAGANSGSGDNPDVIETRVNSEVELLTDSDLMEHLVIYRGSLVQDQPVPPHGSKAMGLAIRSMAGRFEIVPVKKSNVIEITYTDLDPSVAQKVLQEMMSTYIEKHVHFTRANSSSSFFSTEADRSLSDLQAAEAKLTDFRVANEFSDLSKEKDFADDNLHTLRQTLLTDKSQLASTTQQIRQLQNQLAKLQSRVVTTVTVSPNQAGIQVLIASLAELKNKRISLLSRYKPTDRLIVELNAEIDNSQRALDDLRKDNTSTSTDNNPTAVLLQQQLESLQVQRAGLETTINVVQQQADTFQKRLDHLVEITPQNLELERQVAELTGVSQSVTGKRDDAYLEDMLDKSGFGNVGVAEQPTFSLLHTKPKLTLDTMLATVTAFFLCGALVFILESKRKTILTSEDLEKISGAPVLGSLPDSRIYSEVSGGLSRTFHPRSAGMDSLPLLQHSSTAK